MKLSSVAVMLLAVTAAVQAAPTPDLWLVRDGAGEHAREAERPFNPASLVKLATSWWALERLGPDHRFETLFERRGTIDAVEGTLRGDLLVRGGADPDFHVENAWLVAEALGAAGVRRVTGDLVIDRRLWVGWEGGGERRLRDPARRAGAMAARLRDALDPPRLDSGSRAALAAFLERRGDDRAVDAVGVEILGRARAVRVVPESDGVLVVHRSNPLVRLLKRFNSYSNNDIERLADVLGDEAALGAYVRRALERGPHGPRFATLSGLGSNRMTARDVVDVIDRIEGSLAEHGLALGDVLPVAGCDPGTLERFPALAAVGPVAAKTGSLTATDGGVATLAGRLDGVTFCAASLDTGRELGSARALQDRWLAGRLGSTSDRRGPTGCDGSRVVYSDHDARVVVADPAGP